MSSSSIARRLAADRQGGPLAEMAIVLLPFLLLLALLIEGGNLLWRHQIAAKAVRDATRFLSRQQTLVGPGCLVDAGAFAAASAAAQVLGATGRLAGAAPLVPGWTSASIAIPAPVIAVSEPCTVLVGAVATVELALPFASVLRIFDPAAPAALSFSVADQARWLGE